MLLTNVAACAEAVQSQDSDVWSCCSVATCGDKEGMHAVDCVTFYSIDTACIDFCSFSVVSQPLPPRTSWLIILASQSSQTRVGHSNIAATMWCICYMVFPCTGAMDESCWFTVHPASNQRSEGEKVCSDHQVASIIIIKPGNTCCAIYYFFVSTTIMIRMFCHLSTPRSELVMIYFL